MHSGVFCEKCCEQIAGVPPEIDWRGFIHVAYEYAIKAITVSIVGIFQIIGFICFFSVAIWFHPISGPLSPRDKKLDEERKARIERERSEREARQQENDQRRKNAEASRDSGANPSSADSPRHKEGHSEQESADNEHLRNLVNKEIEKLNDNRNFTYDGDGDGIGKDDAIISKINALTEKLEKGQNVDPEEVYRKQIALADELQKKRISESNKSRERDSTLAQIYEAENKLKSVELDLHYANKEGNYSRAKQLAGEANGLYSKILGLEGKYRSLR